MKHIFIWTCTLLLNHGMQAPHKEIDASMELHHHELHHHELSFYSQEMMSHDGSKISFFKAFVNYFKSVMGISIIAVPYAANQAGYVYASILFTIVYGLALRYSPKLSSL